MSQLSEALKKPTDQLTEADLEAIVSGSFLRNVPALVAEGHTFDEALKLAFERDEMMLIELQITAERKSSHSFRGYTDKEKAYGELVDGMAANVYRRINAENSATDQAENN